MKDPRYPFALEPGTEIGGYRIDKVLGAGGFGITYRGFNDITHKQVAIKEFFVREISNRDGLTVVLDQDVDRDTYEYALRKFQEEAQAVVTRFVHPNIIRGENFLRAHNTCYLIMDYIEGANLDDWLSARKSPPDEAELRPMVEKLLDAVDYVHARNVMHRDLTPRNIMIRANGDPVLIDFGAAGLGIDLGRTSKIVAQLRYAPPEQSDETSSGVHGRYTDIFSLAGVLFRCVTGKSPTAPTTRMTRIGSYREDGGKDPQGPVATLVADRSLYSDAFLAGIDRGLRLDERQRPQSIADFRRALGWAPALDPADQADAVASADPDAVTQVVMPSKPRHLAEPVPPPITPPMNDPDITRVHMRQTVGMSGPDTSVDADISATWALNTGGPAAPEAMPEVTISAEPPTGRRSFARAFAILACALIAVMVAGWFGAGSLAGFINAFTGPPVVAPYRFTAAINGRAVTLSGYAPSDEAVAAILTAIGQSAPGIVIDNRLRLARGAPASLVESIAAFARHMPDLRRGTLDLVDQSVTIEATADTPQSYVVARRDLSDIVVRAGSGTLKFEPASVSPYAFELRTSGSRSQPIAVMTGYLPDDAARKGIGTAVAAALPSVRIDDRTLVARGAPFDIASVVAYLSPRLGDLDRARLSLTDTGMRLEGTPRDPSLIGKTGSTIDPAQVPGGVSVALAITPLKVSPYIFAVASSEGTLTVSGYIPDAAARAEATGRPLPDLKIIDNLQIADGAPDGAAGAIRFAIDQAQLLETGTITLSDKRISVDGIVRHMGDLSLLASQSRQHAPQGFVIDSARYRLREDVGPQDCDRLALPIDHLDKPPGVLGIATADINPALAIPACRQAIEVFPNVRRFATALGAALQKDGKYGQAMAQLRLSVEAEDPSAMTLLGLMLRDGLGQAPDMKAAIELFNRARALDNSGAMYATGLLYESGMAGYPRDFAEAAKWFVRSANKGNAEANAELGVMAEAGTLRGVPDYRLAYSYALKAAELGLPLAMHRLGLLDEKGLNPAGSSDLARAVDWYTRAANAGLTDSMAALGRLYLGDHGVGPDYIKARDWLGKAAVAGDIPAMLNLGRMDFEGLGSQRNIVAAIAWFEKAAANGHPRSYALLAALYQQAAADGRQPDYTAAFNWNLKGAALNDPDSLYQLGTLYEGGLGRQVDFAKAQENYQRAGDLGAAKGFYALGLMAELGRGRPADLTKAGGYYKRAADLSFPPAMVKLGLFSETGRGVAKNDMVALLEFTKALQLGDAEAYWHAARLTDAGRGGARNPDRVATYLLTAFAGHEPKAVEALSGDMAAFSVETRAALQRRLQAKGLLTSTAADGTYDSATRDAVMASMHNRTN